jgi:hypothetical protein
LFLGGVAVPCCFLYVVVEVFTFFRVRLRRGLPDVGLITY